MTPKVALIVGAGPGLSASVARKLAERGAKVALAARRLERIRPIAETLDGRAFACDAGEPGQVAELFGNVEAALGPPDFVLYNASARARGPFAEVAAEEVERALRVSAYGGFLVAQQAARRMLAAGHGAIFFTGASASVKGYAQSAPFAMGKFALRGLAQSMARELAPGTSTSPTSSSTARSAIQGAPSRPKPPISCSTPTPSPRPTSPCSISTVPPGAGRSRSGPGWRGSRPVQAVAVPGWAARGA